LVLSQTNEVNPYDLREKPVSLAGLDPNRHELASQTLRIFGERGAPLGLRE
jgi:hypothetical protein